MGDSKGLTCMVTSLSSTTTSLVKLSNDKKTQTGSLDQSTSSKGIADKGKNKRTGASQISSDGGLVLVAEPLVNILVHERRFSDTDRRKRDGLPSGRARGFIGQNGCLRSEPSEPARPKD